MNDAVKMYRVHCDYISNRFSFVTGDDRSSETRPDDADEFPTPESLRRANNESEETEPTFDDQGVVEPRPLKRTKDQVFVLADFEAWDNRACTVSKLVLHRVFLC